MLFKDRKEAGVKLAQKLLSYKNQPDTLVLALPRGGVVTGFEVAKALNLPLDVICPRKIGAPFNPELAIGAITETGAGIFNEDLISEFQIPEDYIKRKVAEEKKQAERRLHLFRKDRPKRNVEDKVVILIDDGLATGSTMKAAIQTVKNEGAAKIVVAVPVAPSETCFEIEQEVDEVVVLAIPSFFAAIGQFYEDFSQTEDEEVVELLACQKK
jgi:putative phosphoribosyl transferase